jgi:hypothetical protein
MSDGRYAPILIDLNVIAQELGIEKDPWKTCQLSSTIVDNRRPSAMTLCMAPGNPPNDYGGKKTLYLPAYESQYHSCNLSFLSDSIYSEIKTTVHTAPTVQQ